MGLDNGIVVKGLPRSKFPRDFDFLFEWEKDDKDGIHICYWRKCWNIKRDAYYIFDLEEWEGGGGEWDITDVNKLKIFLRELKRYNDKNHYLEFDDCIWDFEDLKSQNKGNIQRLKWLINYLEKHPKTSAKVEFYDSY